ncbi:MAG: SDR family oxidoreductase [Betaproteobacteria bacterium]|nr:SDR family oxidoreductase [Betaproteobacteria bacterium]
MQRVIITGASSGIGRREAALAQLAAQLPSATLIYPADVRDAAALQAAAADFIARHGCPDIVIANAGVSIGTLTEFAADTPTFQEVIDINVVGMVKTFQPFLAAMRAAGRGALVGIASVAGYRGLPGAAAYCASKAAAISYLESLRIELAASGIKVITICPGYIATPMTAQNPYPMPFLLSADAAARKIAALIESGRGFAVIPWQMAIVARILRTLPNWLYDRLFGNAPRKPRRAP